MRTNSSMRVLHTTVVKAKQHDRLIARASMIYVQHFVGFDLIGYVLSTDTRLSGKHLPLVCRESIDLAYCLMNA